MLSVEVRNASRTVYSESETYLPVLGADDEHGALVVCAAAQCVRVQTADLLCLVFVNRLAGLEKWNVRCATVSQS